MGTKELIWSIITLLEKELRRFMRIWVQTLVPPAVTTSLYFVIFGSLIGPRIGAMDGFDYIQFMIPGLIMLAVITAAYSNVVSSFYGVKFQRAIEELLISPMPNWAILFGYVVGGVARGVMIGVIVFLVSLVFYPNFEIENYGLTILVLFLTSIMFSLMGFINAVYADSFDDTFREGMLGSSDVSIPLALVMMVGFIILFTAICLYLLNKGIGIRQ